MRGHGMTRSVMQRLVARSPHYDVDMLGFNYRMDEIRAAIGLVQLDGLDEMNARRAELVSLYNDQLARLEQGPDGVIPRSALKPRSGLSRFQTTFMPPPRSLYRARGPLTELPVSEEFHRRELTVPLHPKMREEDVTNVVDTLEKALLES